MAGQYFTPEHIANFLVSKIPVKKASNIIDICAGKGNLLIEAKKRWKNSSATAIDIDQDALQKIGKGNNINCIVGDGREIVFDKNLMGKYDVVLANPPFVKADGNTPKIFLNQLKDVIAKCPRITTRLETSMLFSNLELVENRGFLGIILPNGFLNAQAWESCREFILNKYKLLEVVMLPPVFARTEVNSSILIIQNISPSKKNRVAFSQASIKNNQIRVIGKKTIDICELNDRIDCFDFTGTKIKITGMKKLKDLPITIRRGCYSASKAHLIGNVRLIHSTTITEYSKLNGDELYLKYEALDKGLNAKTVRGDILAVRVGNTIGRFAYITEKESGSLVSDCLFRIRHSKKKSLKKLYEYLISEEMQAYLNSSKRGSAAKYITIEDVMNCPIPAKLAKHYI